MVTTYNLADLFELVADAVDPDRTALVTDQRRLTYGELDERANRLAHHLAEQGIGTGDNVGLHLVNGTEYLEGMLAAYKLRAVPVNINYRYVARELEHLYSSLDLAALIIHRQFGPSVDGVLAQVPTLRHVLVVDDDSDHDIPTGVAYEPALAVASAERDFADRSGDDVYCACTGGTTGLPKGVLWRHEDIFFAAMGGGDPTTLEGPITTPTELLDRLPDEPTVAVLPPPLMHVSAHWTAFRTFYAGGRVVLPTPGPLDPAEIWRLVETERANMLVTIGNAMVNPLIDHLSAHDYDTSSLFVMASGGALLSPAARERAQEHLPGTLVVDGFGSTETGVASTTGADARDGHNTFRTTDATCVLDDDLRQVEPGSGRTGRVARRGRIPLGYHGLPEETAQNFPVVDGERFVLTGDIATVDADGVIVLLGRGSTCINTGGEKVFPEEVESALVAHPAVIDAVVVGLPDDTWGERVAAVVELQPGERLDLADLDTHCRSQVAGYKIPRRVEIVSQVERTPNGKPDHDWARRILTDREPGVGQRP